LLESPLVIYTNVPTALARVIASEYTEAHRVEGVPTDGPGWYDQHDAFFVPFSGFGGVTRPGTDGDTLPAPHGPGRIGEILMKTTTPKQAPACSDVGLIPLLAQELIGRVVKCLSVRPRNDQLPN